MSEALLHSPRMTAREWLPYPCDWLSVMIWSVRSAPVAEVVVLRILVLFD